jgi:hypothetical protein
MQPFVSQQSEDPNKELVDADCDQMFRQQVNGRASLVIAGQGPSGTEISDSLSRSESHSGFDNDVATMNSVLYRIRNSPPTRPFTLRDLQFD